MEQNHGTLNEFSGILVGPARNVLFNQLFQFRFPANVPESSLSQSWCRGCRTVFLAKENAETARYSVPPLTS